jgi:uncharacterized membrane protein YidH (DUF202 family)
MKRLTLILITIALSVAAHAQYADNELRVKRGKVYSGEVRLTEAQTMDLFSNVGGVDRTADYQDIAHRYKVGKTMETVGLVTFGVSGVAGVASFLGIFIYMNNKTMFNVSRVSLCTCGVLLWGGAITSICGTAKKRNANQDLRELTLGVQQNGLGLSLRF